MPSKTGSFAGLFFCVGGGRAGLWRLLLGRRSEIGAVQEGDNGEKTGAGKLMGRDNGLVFEAFAFEFYFEAFAFEF